MRGEYGMSWSLVFKIYLAIAFIIFCINFYRFEFIKAVRAGEDFMFCLIILSGSAIIWPLSVPWEMNEWRWWRHNNRV